MSDRDEALEGLRCRVTTTLASMSALRHTLDEAFSIVGRGLASYDVVEQLQRVAAAAHCTAVFSEILIRSLSPSHDHD